MHTSSRERKTRVLAVDDQPANLVALEAVLGGDCELTFAGSGAEAIALLKQTPGVDIILMDIQMPLMDGFETAAEIKKLGGCEDIPIIFITAVYKEDPYIKRGYQVGGVDYFGKPFDPDLLRLKVAVYSSFKRRADALRVRERQVRESEELLKTHRKLSLILKSLPVGVIIVDGAGRVCHINEMLPKILRAKEPTIDYGAAFGWWDSGGSMIQHPGGLLDRALRGETPRNEVMQIRCFDGSDKAILGSASPLRGLDRALAGAAIVIQDVTEPKKIERDLENQITKLVALEVGLEQSVVNQ